jgi:hypothetical protein
MDTAVPVLFQACLSVLRGIEERGEWPNTSVGRRTVIVDEEKSFREVLAERDCVKKEKDKGEAGRGNVKSKNAGASGSFSIGLMPTETGGSVMPAGNEKFPELVKAAFLLERALLPGRPGSSTIAVNRNAQFRPHTDSGAGAGQSLSLIVAMGDYVGGDLMVEGERKDIR